MALIVRKSSISEIENSVNISELLEEYAAESSIKGLPHPFAKVDTYRHLESNGTIHILGAFLDESLIGYMIVLSPVLPHYSVRVAVTESFFVMKKYRKTGAALILLKTAETYAKDQSALGMFMSAPLGGRLAEVLPHVGYAETNRVFFKAFSDE